MSDFFSSAWLPSAIMQTVGALYSIFAVFLILAIQSSIEKVKNKEFNNVNFIITNQHNISLQSFFKGFTLIVIITELYSGILLLYGNYNGIPIFWYLVDYIAFSLCILYLIWLSYNLIIFVINDFKPITINHFDKYVFLVFSIVYWFVVLSGSICGTAANNNISSIISNKAMFAYLVAIVLYIIGTIVLYWKLNKSTK